ncbi:MAG: hypothetical protein JXR56_03120 [Candidatus Cloacimonetes bacterium]|nr:hypothetical protein [Candidatus Cloacimonadota bacterium]
MKLTDKARDMLDLVSNKLLNNDIGNIVDFARFTVSGYDTPMSHWSPLNQLLVFMTTNSLDCRGFRQWQSVNRYVKKGAKATYILVPLVKTEKGERNEELKHLLGFKTVPVFPLHATEGEPLPELKLPEKKPNLYEVAEVLNIQVIYEGMTGAYGSCKSDATIIRLGNTHPAIFYHELAHAVRLKKGWYRKTDYAGEEIIAETVACTLSKLLDDEDITADTSQYVKYYANDSVQKVINFLSEISKTLVALLDIKSNESIKEMEVYS